jgi:restriction endonuclease S subunit
MLQSETIRTLAEICAGYQHRPKDELVDNGEFLLIQQKDISSDRTRVDYANTVRITPERQYTRQLLVDGDVVFMNKGQSPFGCAIRNLPEPAIASSAFFILRPNKERILPEYLAWVLNREQTRHELFSAAGHGTLMPVIHRKALEEQSIFLPPMEMQRTLIGGVCSNLISGTTEV